MSTFSDYLENKVLDHLFGNTAYTVPSTLYLALFTTNPNFETGSGGTEVSGNNYSRLSVTNNTTNFPNASAGAKSNGADLTFATPSGTWGTITGFGIYDASTTGNLLAGAALGTSKTVNSGDTVKFNTGDLDITLT